MNIEVHDIALRPRVMIHNKYEISEVHYLGNFGIVYFGFDITTGQDVVIKEFMPYKLANRDMDGKTIICKSQGCLKEYNRAKKSFFMECKFVEQLSTIKKPYEKCTIPFIDSFEENGTVYLITERITGRSLQDYIENGDNYSIRNISVNLVEIVYQIHKKGIVHCDIKPSNIIIRDDGKLSLIDFGSACEKKRQDEYLAFVSRGFSAPELYKSEYIDEKTDYYSIGALMYYMLTDTQLPDPNDYDDDEKVPFISEYVPIDTELEDMILSMVERDRKKRPKNLKKIKKVLLK